LIGPDGSFTVKTSYGEGAPEGAYKVRIEPDETMTPPSKVKSSRRNLANLPFPAKYTEEATSGLSATIKPGDNPLEPFKLIK
jgi:hypothetical protein